MTDFYFKIFNTTWTVTYVDKIEEEKAEGFIFGHTNTINNKIRVATKDMEGNNLPLEALQLTTLHELVHAILSSGQYETCNNDEPLVEWIANCLYSLKQQEKL